MFFINVVVFYMNIVYYTEEEELCENLYLNFKPRIVYNESSIKKRIIYLSKKIVKKVLFISIYIVHKPITAVYLRRYSFTAGV